MSESRLFGSVVRALILLGLVPGRPRIDSQAGCMTKMGLDARKPVFGVANNTGADQPGHPRSLISAFVNRFLKSIIYKLATGKISNF